MNSKKFILNNFLQLASKKEISDIRVSDVAKVCNISRQGFYYHFSDIFDLVYYAVEENMKYIIEDSKSLIEGLDKLFTYSFENKKILLNAIEDEANKEIEIMLHRSLMDLLRRINDYENIFNSKNLDFVISYHSYGILAMVFEYIQGKRPSKDAIIQVIIEEFALQFKESDKKLVTNDSL